MALAPLPLSAGRRGDDVADYRAVDPRFGTLADAHALIGRAAQVGLHVLLVLVPNHSSDAHPWFQATLRAGPGSSERDRCVLRDGPGPGGERPPNNWTSVFVEVFNRWFPGARNAAGLPSLS